MSTNTLSRGTRALSGETDASLLAPTDTFARRHIGPSDADVAAMLGTLGLASLEDLVRETVPASIRRTAPLDLPAARGEREALLDLRTKAAKNQVFRSFLGMGYHGCVTPGVILRNILENPGWYTAYTPYQAEIAQGRLEALLNFQTMVADLTGLPLANASLLDEATAAAEAMHMAHAVARGGSRAFFVAEDCHPQTIAVVKTRALPLGIDVVVGPASAVDLDGRRLLRRPRPVPDHRRPGRRLRRPRGPHPRRGCLVRGGRRPPGPDPAPRPRRVRGRRLRGLRAALRRAHGLRRSPRRLPLHPRGAQARRCPAGSSACRTTPEGKTGLPHGAPDPRAAHPPRQGHEQHLHRAGAAGGDGQHVRGLPRTRRAFAPSRARACLDRGPRRGAPASGQGRGRETRSSTPSACVSRRPKPTPSLARARERRINLRPYADGSLGVALDETVTAAEIDLLLEVFAGRRAAFAAADLLGGRVARGAKRPMPARAPS